MDYYYKATYTPVLLKHKDYGFYRVTKWKVQNRDGSDGHFTSRWFLGHVQVYIGTAKCDGSESHREPFSIVMVDAATELKAFRYVRNGPGFPVWDNMGGS